jgi:glycine/D-amino acid oxidase-like deaminating enzyme
VLVLEKSFLGAGSSGKSGAIIRQYYSHSLTAGMAQFGLRFFKQFHEIVGGPPVFSHAGMVLVVAESDRKKLENNLAMQRGLGIKTKAISPDELKSIDPHAELADDEVAAFEEEAGYCDALQVVFSLAERARQMGVEVRERTQVTAISLSGTRVVGVQTTSGPVHSRTVILAAGPWAGRLAGMAGAPVPVQSCRTQVALFRRPCDFGSPRPVYGDFRQQIYFKPTAGEMLHVGNIDPREERSLVDPDDYNEVADCEFIREMSDKLNHRYATMRRGISRGGYGALYAVTPDWHPILDQLPGIEGLFCAVGFSGHGFKLSPAVATLLGELVLDGGATSFEIRPLRATRFAEGELFGDQRLSYSVMG